MSDLFSTNNVWGWLCMFAAHLISACGIEREKVVEAVLSESRHAAEYDWQDRYGWKEGYENHPEWKNRYMSDNQCIMITNGWFYTYGKGKFFHFKADRDSAIHIERPFLTLEEFNEGVDYWLTRK